MAPVAADCAAHTSAAARGAKAENECAIVLSHCLESHSTLDRYFCFEILLKTRLSNSMNTLRTQALADVVKYSSETYLLVI